METINEKIILYRITPVVTRSQNKFVYLYRE